MNRPALFTIVWASVAATAILAAPACSGGNAVPDAADASDAQPNPSWDGTHCIFEGQRYAVGDVAPPVDACNTCYCGEGGRKRCTMAECIEPVDAGGSCAYGAKTYDVGTVFPSIDSCDTCRCVAPEVVSCTEKNCPFTCPDVTAVNCRSPIYPPQEKLCIGPYHDWVAKNCEVEFQW